MERWSLVGYSNDQNGSHLLNTGQSVVWYSDEFGVRYLDGYCVLFKESSSCLPIIYSIQDINMCYLIEWMVFSSS